MLLTFLLEYLRQIFAAQCRYVNASGNTGIIDALMIVRYYIGSNPAGFNSAVADGDDNSTINIVDALMVAQYSAEIISRLSCAGITPARTATPTFTPAAVITSYPTVGPNGVVVDFAALRQVIDGNGVLSDAEMDALFGNADNAQMGLAICHVHFLPDRNFAEDKANAAGAKARGAIILASVWSPPASMNSNNRIAGGNLIDKDENIWYASSDLVTPPTIEFTLNGNKTFDCVMVPEVIKLGERVTGWLLDANYNSKWNTVTTKRCIGYKWIERFNAVTASAVRLRITAEKACPVLHTFGIFLRSNSTSLPTPTPIVPARSAYIQIEAESFNNKSGAVKTEACGEGGENLGYISTGDWVQYSNIDFGNGAASFQARVAYTVDTGKIYIRLDSPAGTQIGTLTGPDTGNAQTYTTVTCPVTSATGVHDLYLCFDAWLNLNWFKFVASMSPTPTPAGIKGDGTITIVDALMTAQYVVDLTPAGFITANADVNCDSSITIVDALMMAQYYVGLIARFPC